MSDKIRTVVRIGGQEYKLSGYESEEYMHRVAIYVDRKMNEISKNFTDLNTTMIAVLAALNIADELIQERNRHHEKEQPELLAGEAHPSVSREKVAVLKKDRVKF